VCGVLLRRSGWRTAFNGSALPCCADPCNAPCNPTSWEVCVGVFQGGGGTLVLFIRSEAISRGLEPHQ
jgi:hypothetical protein